MIKNITLTIIVALFSITSFSQEIYEGNLQINAGLNLMRTPDGRVPLEGIKDRINGDLEVNYFLQDKFALGAGFNYSTQLKRTDFSTGIRYYWIDESFFRSKLHLPTDFSEFDFSIGVGYNYMLGDDVGLESNLDYYIKGESATFRFGIALFL